MNRNYSVLFWASVIGFTVWRLVVLYFMPLPISPDEGQYWLYSLDPAMGYYSKPPLLPWVIHAGTVLWGDNPFGIRFFIPFIHGLNAVLLFLTARLFFTGAVPCLSGLTYLLLPAVTYSSGLASTDPVMMMGWMISLYALSEILHKPRLGYAILMGLGWTIGVLGKYTMVTWFVSLGLASFFIPTLRKKERLLCYGVAFITMVMTLMPHILWNADFGFVTVKHVGENANLQSGSLFHFSKLLEFLSAQFGVFGPVLMAFLPLSVWTVLRKKDHKDGLALLLWFTVPLLSIILAQSFLSRAHANWAAASYLAGSGLVVAVLYQKGYHRLLRWNTVFYALLAVALPVLNGVLETSYREHSAKIDPARKLRGSEDVALKLLDIRQKTFEETGEMPLLLSQDRKWISMVLYHARLKLKDTLFWSPSPTPRNHYELVSGLKQGENRPLFYFTVGIKEAVPLPTDIQTAFHSIVSHELWTFQTHKNQNIVLSVWKLQGFQGYAVKNSLPQ